MTTPERPSADEMAVERTVLAAKRTLMAADRSLMAWIRTSLSMISFVFTIYKELQGFEAAGAVLPRDDTPRDVGLFLTGLGTVAMVMGTIDYWQMHRDLPRLQPFRIWRPSFILALIMSVTGLFLFVSIISRLL